MEVRVAAGLCAARASKPSTIMFGIVEAWLEHSQSRNARIAFSIAFSRLKLLVTEVACPGKQIPASFKLVVLRRLSIAS